MQDEELTRKEHRSKKKLVSKLDRSKFKKTDQEKWSKKQQQAQQQKHDKRDLSEGRVLSISPESILVDSQGGQIHCSLGGVLKKEKTLHKNIIAVGDFVLFEEESGRVVGVKPRQTILSRQDHLRRKKEQIIAANIDQVLITISVVSPPLKPALIDRYLIAAEKGGMQPVILINKIDLLKKGSKEAALYREVKQLYTSLGIPVLGISMLQNKGIQALKKQMKNKASVFSGQSGVGKSSLINAMTGLDLPIGEMRKENKGMHTTTSAQLIVLPFGGWCIDTPGIRSFGIWALSLDDLLEYFPEIDKLGKHCHFPNCTHIHEPHCHVIESVERGELSVLRYESYVKLRQELSQKHPSIM